MFRRLRCTRLAPFSLRCKCRATVTPLAGSGEVVNLIAETTPLNQAVLALLLLFSIASWAIILQKTWAFRASDRDTARFLDAFRQSSKFSEVQAVCSTLPATPLVGVFQAGYAEINAQFRVTTTAQPASAGSLPTRSSRVSTAWTVPSSARRRQK